MSDAPKSPEPKPQTPSRGGSATPGANEDFAAMFAASEKGQKRRRGPRFTVGDRVTGRLVSIGQQVSVIELPDGGEGTLDTVELRDDAGELVAHVGDNVDARVAALGEKDGSVVLRRAPVRGADARAGLAQAAETGLPVEGTVTGVNKGGLDVSIAGARAFCPVSQIDLRPVADPSVYVGQKLNFRITKFEDDRRGPNLVVSRRALLEDEAREKATVTRASLTVGAVIPGVVSALKDFGAFIDIGGLDGLLPASEIGFQRGVRPGDVLSIGQPVTVQVLRIEKRPADQKGRNTEQITLSLKSLERDPWEDAVAQLQPGTTRRGRIARAETFGAFVELAPGVEGLLHISELGAGKQLRHARDAVKPGDTVDVTVLAVDREKRRVSLGLASDEDRVDAEGRAAADRAAAPKGMGTFGDLLKGKLGTK